MSGTKHVTKPSDVVRLYETDPESFDYIGRGQEARTYLSPDRKFVIKDYTDVTATSDFWSTHPMYLVKHAEEAMSHPEIFPKTWAFPDKRIVVMQYVKGKHPSEEAVERFGADVYEKYHLNFDRASQNVIVTPSGKFKIVDVGGAFHSYGAPELPHLPEQLGAKMSAETFKKLARRMQA